MQNILRRCGLTEIFIDLQATSNTILQYLDSLSKSLQQITLQQISLEMC